MESTATNRVWKKGPPPHVGWWNASTCRDPRVWRWWDGKQWSRSILSTSGVGEVTRGAERTAPLWNRPNIEWNNHWPERACVPRLEGEWTFHHGDAGPAPGRIVDIVLRGGRQCTGLVESWAWDHTALANPGSRDYDIVAWRFA